MSDKALKAERYRSEELWPWEKAYRATDVDAEVRALHAELRLAYQERDALLAERDAVRAAVEALDKAYRELNAIRARDGAPQVIDWDRGRPMQHDAVSPEYFSQIVDECESALAALRQPKTSQN